MTTPDQIPADLTLSLEGEISPDDFMSAVRGFFGYIKEITEAQIGDGSEINWTVRVSEGSNLIGVIPNENAPASRLAMIYEKARFGPIALASGGLNEAGLSDTAIGYLQNLSDLSGRQPNTDSINLWVKKQRVTIGPDIAQRIREDSESDYYDFGTIEGRLERIQDAAGSIKIRVKDYLYPKPVNCSVPEDMLDLVFASFRRRVEVDGQIHYRKDGTPISISVTEIDLLPEDDELPSAADVRGIMAIE